VMLGGLSMMAGSVCQVLRGLLVMFCSFLRHSWSSFEFRLQAACKQPM
jgi:hypothetical protein